MKQLIKWGRSLAHPRVFFYCGLWMMVLLIAGTISQKYIGLYQARLQFFSSFVFWFYGLPLPGGRMAMGLILLSLGLKTMHSLPFLKTKKQFSSFVMHLGVILLLIGGFITGLFSQEGYMVLAEGDKSSVVQDYHKVELGIDIKTSQHTNSTRSNNNKTQTLKAFHEQSLVAGQVLTGPFPFSLKIQEFMKNAEPVFAPQQKGGGMPSIVNLKTKKLEKVNEENQAGLLFQIISQTGFEKGATLGTSPSYPENLNREFSNKISITHKKSHNIKNYALFEPIPQTVVLHGQKYIIRLRPIRTYLPFSLKLIDFTKENYPGSHKAKSYQSQVHVLDKGITQRRIIKMNSPLRYKDYTFYQSSYIEGPQKESSVLAVVKNAGQAWPYISSLFICFSLLLYILAIFWPSFSKPREKK